MGLRKERLTHRMGLQLMNGSMGRDITHMTVQTFRFTATNGPRIMRIEFLIADIAEGFVLGHNWLKQINPMIDWQTEQLAWRHTNKPPSSGGGIIISARRARKQIIQGAIQSNEPPEWVKREHAAVLRPREPGTLPPHRQGFDYELRMKPGFKPQRDKPRRWNSDEREAFRRLAEESLREGYWRVSRSPQAVQMLWAAKAGGEKRPCTDYRRLNAWMEDDAYPVPNIRDLMMDIAGSSHLTSLDIPKAYHEIRVKDGRTRELLAFQCGDEIYEPEVMQFGSKTAVAWFQRFINHVLRRNLGKGVLAYLDNIIIYAKTQKEHDRLLREALEDLEANGLRVKPEKCEWDKPEVQFCGFLVSADGVRLDPEKLAAVRDWPSPKHATEKKTAVREFLGFCNFYRDHIHRFSEIAAPLTSLTSKTTPWEWGKAEEASFQLLKVAVVTAPVVGQYDPTKPIEFHTDASDKAIAGIAEQRDSEGKLRPLGYHSKKLNAAEQNYPTHDKELLAVVQTLRKFHHWCAGKVKVWTDHAALRHFLTTTQLTQRHARWAQELGEYHLEIAHVAGRANRAADALSRSGGGGVNDSREVMRPLRQEHFQEGGWGQETHQWKDSAGRLLTARSVYIRRRVFPFEEKVSLLILSS